ncbi:Armadillo-like helical [Penicillium frequentans]|uniref:Armadillo-like helical n=1 Tax=Penicillium frequentans TaxID=3151616 RepID=A0AAD6GGY9_9EURO|nr:Armadillo-like helical [Penicillium glabrum]
MAFKNGLSERLDELRFPSPRSPPSESTYNPLSPGSSNFGSGFSRPSSDVRANLQRRFTTDSSKLTSWNFLNQGSTPMPDPLDLLSSFEKKRQHIEYMREQKRRFEEDMKLLDIQHEKEKIEMDKLARDLAKAGIAGRASEPTTPPEYREPTLSSAGRPARFPSTSVTSSPGFFSAFAPSNVTSPQAPQSNHSHAQSVDRFVAHSLPGSRRNSEKDSFLFDTSIDPSTIRGSSHRNSMPSNNHYNPYRPNMNGHMNGPTNGHANGHMNGHMNGNTNGNTNGYMNGHNATSGFDSFSAVKHFFHDDDRSFAKDEPRLSTPDIKGYIRMTEPDDKFPTLRREGTNLLAANPDAHDLANSRTSGHETYSYHNRNRSSHQSMPQSLTDIMRLDRLGGQTEDHSSAHRHHARHSLEGGLVFPNERSDESMTPVPSHSRPSARVSYSTNDVPTVRGTGFDAAITPPKTHAEHLHHRNASNVSNVSVGRISNGIHSHQARGSPDSPNHNNQSGQTMLQASAAPFGPQITSPMSNNGINSVNGSVTPVGMPFPAFNQGMQAYGAHPSQMMPSYAEPNPYGAYPNHASNGYRANDVPIRGGNSLRRATEGEASQYQISRDLPQQISQQNRFDASQQNRFDGQQQNRFIHPLEHYKGELYSLCKDQHGCRYLQRKLDDDNPDNVQLIFSETYMHVTDLMMDPFGNYLVQKLLDLANDEQRTVLIDNAAPQLVTIAFNQHGTRALQKMIETISTHEQTQTVIDALADHVVDLVKDLNGNHVIQKCLNRLRSEDADFIYEAVGGACIVVGTHRHGCCVLQRCIDHASGAQKAHLVSQITDHSYKLVQDPFGNYVVQYILDLNEPSFTTPICQGFLGNVIKLAMHKFSSNVVEKCLRTCSKPVRREMIDEMINSDMFADCLRHQYGNYVIQTALDNADPQTCNRIIEAIRPVLPTIRQTPHGRRIASKILVAETHLRTNSEHTLREINSTNQLANPRPKKSEMASGINDYGLQTFPPTPASSSTANTPLAEATRTP